MDNKKENYLSIGEVSRLLNIPEHTLRYWQEAKIFSVSQGTNNYRQYTVADLLNIAEIAFYRNIGIPVREMERFSHFSLEDYGKVLQSVRERLEQTISNLESMRSLAALKARHVQEIAFLRQTDFVMEEVPFHSVSRFLYSDREKLVRYTRNPSLYVRCIDTRDFSSEIRGIIADDLPTQEEIIWRKIEKEKQPFAAFLIEEYPEEAYANNIAEGLAPIRRLHKTGILLANFLLSEIREGRKIDYLKGYVELLS